MRKIWTNILWKLLVSTPYRVKGNTLERILERTKKSLTQEVRQKSNISECRSKVRPLQPLLSLQLGRRATERPVRGHLTLKMNINFVYQKSDTEYYLIQQFFRKKKPIFSEKTEKNSFGAHLTIV